MITAALVSIDCRNGALRQYTRGANGRPQKNGTVSMAASWAEILAGRAVLDAKSIQDFRLYPASYDNPELEPVTYEEMRAAVTMVNRTFGLDAVLDILKSYGAATLEQVRPADYAEIVAKCKNRGAAKYAPPTGWSA